MRRRIIMALLAVGAVSGFAMGFSHLHRGCQNQRWQEHAAQEHRQTDCVDHARDGTSAAQPQRGQNQNAPDDDDR